MADEIQQQILEELKEIKDLLVSMSDDGTPIRNMVPSPDFIAAVASATALIAKEVPNMSAQDLESRVRTAMQIGFIIVKDFNAWQEHTRAGRLEMLFHEDGKR